MCRLVLNYTFRKAQQDFLWQLHLSYKQFLMEVMMQEIANLRKTVKLRIPQSHYALVSQLMREGKVISSEYEGDDVLLEVEIPHYLEHKVTPFYF